MLVLVLTASLMNMAFCQKSWIYLKDYDVLKDYYGEETGTVYVYDVSHEDEVFVRNYPSAFFHDPYSVEPYHTDSFSYFQCGDILYTKLSRDPVLHMYAIGEKAELTEMPGINLKDHSGKDYLGPVRVNGNRLYIYNDQNMYSFDISDPWNPLFLQVKKLGSWVFDFDFDTGYGEYFTSLTQEQMNALSPHPMEGYVWVLPDGHIISYKYHYHYADISPFYTTFENWASDSENTAEEKAFCTGNYPDGFGGMRRTRLFGNVLVKFEEGIVRRYTVHEGGYVTSLGKEELYKAIEDGDEEMLRKLSVQCPEYYTTEAYEKVMESGNLDLMKIYFSAKHSYDSYWNRNPLFTAVSNDNADIVRLLAELHPEWLSSTYDPERSMSYSYGLMDCTQNKDMRDLLVELGAPAKIGFGYNLGASSQCYLYDSPYADAPVVKVPSDYTLYCSNRMWVKKDGEYVEWYQLKLNRKDENVWYIPVGSGSYYWYEP